MKGIEVTLRDISYKNSYKSPRDNVVQDFLIPSLKEAVEYDRAVGFFSSSVLLSLSVGIVGLLKNNGKIRLICSHKLSKEDIDAIQKGYETKKDYNEIISKILEKDFRLPKDDLEKERFNILSHLISANLLDIRIAFSKNFSSTSMFHDKLGVITDSHGNFVSFSGSLNESLNAFEQNYENIDVYTSFSGDYPRALEKKEDFENLWNNEDSGAVVIKFPQNLKNVIKKYEKSEIDFDIDKKQFNYEIQEVVKKNPELPYWLELRDYQIEAIESWKENNYIGIYDMATGTGKTLTALGSVIELLKNLDYKLGIVICCPYQHLVDQWCEDLKSFNFKSIVGYSGSPQTNWKRLLKKQAFEYSNNLKKNFCFITTNASFRTEYVQNIISNVRGDLLLVVDEAHNFGSKGLGKLLDDRFNYRLALSATLDRHNDEDGTELLYDYFGNKCIEYSLERAINEDKLTSYYYYPIPVYLTEDELEEYNTLSKKIAKYVTVQSNGKVSIAPGAEMLLIKRARLVAGAYNKIEKLKEIIQPFKNDNHMLIYCGSTTIKDNDYDEFNPEKSEIRQVEAVSMMLNEQLNMKVSRFTSKEKNNERKLLIKEFDDGDTIQALVAIRCLDEGVNIPSIKTAFILASSTNPKEYIQRRGRVLRLFPGKKYATIFDFVTLPRDLDEIQATDALTYDMSLIRREIDRVKDFANLSLNSRDSDKLINKIESIYGTLEEDIDYE